MGRAPPGRLHPLLVRADTGPHPTAATECVPRDGVDPAAVPQHTSLRFGDPAYGQLRHTTHPAIRRGADDESEMGASHELYAPQREANLAIRLDEYLRFGLQAGWFYAT